MRTPVGSSKSRARSLRHSSPVWLPSGVTLTSAAGWPVATVPYETQNNTRRSAAATSDRTRMMSPLLGLVGLVGPADPPDLPDLLAFARARLVPRDELRRASPTYPTYVTYPTHATASVRSSCRAASACSVRG